MPFPDEKSEDSGSESEEDLEPGDQPVVEEMLHPQEASPERASQGGEPMGKGADDTPESISRQQEASVLQQMEEDRVLGARDLPERAVGRDVPQVAEKHLERNHRPDTEVSADRTVSEWSRRDTVHSHGVHAHNPSTAASSPGSPQIL